MIEVQEMADTLDTIVGEYDVPDSWGEFTEMIPGLNERPDVVIATLFALMMDASARFSVMVDKGIEEPSGDVLEDTVALFARFFVDKYRSHS